MTKLLLTLPILMLGACASTAEDAQTYAGYDCKALRELVNAQDTAASARGVEIMERRGMDEIRAESGSPWAGQERTRDESNLVDERTAIRNAYRSKGCTR